jgi:sugar phosphate isomerase/epimerase
MKLTPSPETSSVPCVIDDIQEGRPLTELKLAVQTILVPGASMEKIFTNARDYGFDAIEVAVGPAYDLGEHLPELQAASSNSGLPVAAICTHPMHDPLQPDAAERARRFAGLTDLIAQADALGARGVVSVPLRPARGFSSYAEQQQVVGALIDEAVDAIGAWASSLPAGKAALFIEPLNRSEASMVNRVEQAVEIARRVNNSRVLALADFYHMNIEERDLAQPILEAGPLLGHVHIADNNRLQPGKGMLDFRTPFAALQQIDYQGYVSIECWSPAGPRIEGDPAAAFPVSVRFLREAWNAASPSAV